MGGTGGHPLNFTYRKVKYRKSGGEPPVPPIASHSLPLKYKCLPWPPAFIYFIKDATYASQPPSRHHGITLPHRSQPPHGPLPRTLSTS